MKPNNIILIIIYIIPYLLIILSLIAYGFLISAGNFEEKKSRIDSSYLFEISGILFVLNYALLLVYYLIFEIIPPITNEINFNTAAISMLSFSMNFLFDILIVGASILFIIIGAKNTRYFHLIVTGSLYIVNILIAYVFSFIFNLISQTQGIRDINFVLLFNLIESLTMGTIILVAEISFLLFSVKYERDFDPVKNRFKTTGILLVVGAVLALVYSTIYLGLGFFSL